MKTKLFLSLFALFVLTSCLNDDTPEDKVETMNMAISAMTYIDSPVMANYPIEGMRAKVGNDTDYQFMAFNQIEGFTFKPGYAYELRVERTTLGNPPADASRYTYKLIDELLKQPVKCTRETVRLYVSAEMGNYDWEIPQMDDAHCMKIRESVNTKSRASPTRTETPTNFRWRKSLSTPSQRTIVAKPCNMSCKKSFRRTNNCCIS